MFERMGKIVGGGNDDVFCRCGGHVYVMGKPRNCVGDTFFAGGGDEDTVLAVMVHGWAEVPGLCVVWGPGASSVEGALMNKDLHAGRCKWCGIVVEGAVKLGVGGEIWIDSGRAEKIECDFTLGEKFIPKS